MRAPWQKRTHARAQANETHFCQRPRLIHRCVVSRGIAQRLSLARWAFSKTRVLPCRAFLGVRAESLGTQLSTRQNARRAGGDECGDDDAKSPLAELDCRLHLPLSLPLSLSRSRSVQMIVVVSIMKKEKEEEAAGKRTGSREMNATTTEKHTERPNARETCRLNACVNHIR